MKSTVIVQVSGGAGSALAYLRCCERYRSVVGLYANTNSEHPDLYDLIDELGRVTGNPVVRINNDGKTIWDVFDKERLLKTPNGACKASVELKTKPLARWIQEHYTAGECVLASGMSWQEEERQKRMNARWHPYRVIHPLNARPRLTWCQERAYLADQGIAIPSMYDLGYPHNNCHGACILAGISQWVAVLKDFPEQFAVAEKREAAFYKRTGYTILSDRRGGDRLPMTLSTLRKRVELGEFKDNGFRYACNCLGYATTTEDAPLFDL